MCNLDAWEFLKCGFARRHLVVQAFSNLVRKDNSSIDIATYDSLPTSCHDKVVGDSTRFISWHHDMVLPKWARFVWSRRVPEIQVRMKGCALRVSQKRIEHSLTFQIIIGFGRS